MKSTGDWPKYSLPSLTYHEGVPGHHLQISLAQQSKDIPMLRKLSFYSSYIEGWALYSEQLADELGGYQGHREGPAILQSFLFRSARLVVDTGLNAKGWSREQAVDYMQKTTGFPRAARPARGGALLHLDRPGLQLQGRPPRLAARPREGEEQSSAQNSTSSNSTKC